jgi:hypothetical protein
MSLVQLGNLFAQNAGEAGGSLLFIVPVLFGVVGFVFWLWALVHAIRNPALEGTPRILWILGIVFTGIIGAALYAMIGRNPTRSAEL